MKALVLAVVVLAGCTFRPALPSGGVYCGAHGECPGGLTCHDGLCCAGEACGAPVVDAGCGGGCGDGPAGIVDEGGACDPGQPSLRCRDGLICTTAAGAARCRTTCQTDQPATCGAGKQCVAVAGRSGGCVAGLPPVPAACEPTQVGACPDGQACRFRCVGPAVAQTTCEMGVGSKRAGDLCANDGECGGGMICGTHSCAEGSKVGYCHPMCKTSADCPGVVGCLPVGCDGDTQYGACQRTCDPLAPATKDCPAGLACRLQSGDVTDCLCYKGGPNGADGAACAAAGDCQPGFTCLARGATSLCRRICRTAGNDCPPATFCASQPDHVTYGACVPTAGDTPPECETTRPESCPNGDACFSACTAAARSTVSCNPPGTAAQGQPCPNLSDCTAGNTCTAHSCGPGLPDRAVCARSCRVDADCGGGASRCVRSACGGHGTADGYCTVNCDPLGPATRGCPAGLTCVLSFGEITDCSCSEGKALAVEGGACTSNRGCQPGATCVVEGMSRVCRVLCRLDAPLTCPTGTHCAPLPDQRIHGACVP